MCIQDGSLKLKILNMSLIFDEKIFLTSPLRKKKHDQNIFSSKPFLLKFSSKINIVSSLEISKIFKVFNLNGLFILHSKKIDVD